jgi:hypothetical protein
MIIIIIIMIIMITSLKIPVMPSGGIQVRSLELELLVYRNNNNHNNNNNNNASRHLLDCKPLGSMSEMFKR